MTVGQLGPVPVTSRQDSGRAERTGSGAKRLEEELQKPEIGNILTTCNNFLEKFAWRNLHFPHWSCALNRVGFISSKGLIKNKQKENKGGYETKTIAAYNYGMTRVTGLGSSGNTSRSTSRSTNGSTSRGTSRSASRSASRSTGGSTVG